LKKVRTLLITFDNDVQPYEIEAFRGAIINKVGKEQLLFHNHLGDDSYSYRYPLIQYKTVKKKPAVFCLDHGADCIHHLFQGKSRQIELKGRKIELKISDLQIRNTTLNVWERRFDYFINNWQALNEKNFPLFNEMDSLGDRIGMLGRILVGNLLSMAKGLDWHIDRRIIATITNLESEHLRRMKEIKVNTFNLRFSSNVYLPDYIGIGKGASKGFGVVKQVGNRRHE
jgi:hypothetical protein